MLYRCWNVIGPERCRICCNVACHCLWKRIQAYVADLVRRPELLTYGLRFPRWDALKGRFADSVKLARTRGKCGALS